MAIECLICLIRTQPSPDIFYQQFFSRCHNDYSTIQIPLENRTLFQMDQTASAHQSVLRDLGERGQNPDLDRNLHLRAGCDYQKTIKSEAKSLHNSTNLKRNDFRENVYLSSTYRN